MRIVVVAMLILGMVGGAMEKASRFTVDSKVFSKELVPVSYHWTGSEWGDPVNVGADRKWFGFASYDAEIAIPSYQAHSQGRYDISRDSFTMIAPVPNVVYNCENGWWTVTCRGLFRYRLDRDKSHFEANRRIITNPPANWLEDTRSGTLTVYKFF